MDALEIRGKCASEENLAIRARDALRDLLVHAQRIDLREVQRGKYFRILARMEADGVDVAPILIEKGLARPYHGGKRESWCRYGKS